LEGGFILVRTPAWAISAGTDSQLGAGTTSPDLADERKSVMVPAMTGSPEKARLIALRGYVCDATGCASERITTVTRFQDGNRHAVHRVSYLDAAGITQDVVIRVSLGGDKADCDQAEREAAVLEKVGGVAAPVLYDFRCTSRWFDTPAMCMEFVPGRHRELNSASLREIERLASIVARVHELDTGDLVRPLAATGNVASYAEGRLQSITSTLAWARDPLPAELRTQLTHAADSLATRLHASQHAESFRTGEHLALLHGDIAPGNVLWDREPTLIDWEYTRLGDPADEIAYLFDQNALTEPQRQAFWDGYRRSVSTPSRLPLVMDRVDWWEPVTLLGSALWWVERWVRRTERDTIGAADPAVHREPDYYFDHVMRRLARLKNLVAPP
jgi:aminoglycoside phosphotransferase (APT) family kinase protein